MTTIGILLFSGVEELDFVGPFEVLSYINKLIPHSTRVLLVAEGEAPLTAANGLCVVPHCTFAACPDLDILVVPGGQGRLTAMHNPVLLNFVCARAPQLRWLTSVCTGAFVLAEAGLLHGKRATTYHTALDELRAYPHIQVQEGHKVVHDGRVITGAGVSSGLELGLYLLTLLFGTEKAQRVAERIEYRVDVTAL